MCPCNQRAESAECPGGLYVDNKLDLGALLHRQVAGLLAIKDVGPNTSSD
jgi:hypothetical protein